ncbi:MAG: DNA topoisomerase IV subunit A, partial [Porticoccaceae bacterium]|nr:DNA topoisomerase IV subunit A [Porticoccaceae bacterium]
FLSAAKGKSNQNVFLQDTTGRFYALPGHTLPSARGQGEPATGRLKMPPGALFTDVVMGPDNQKILLGTDAGYGFIGTITDLYTKNKAGKAVVSISKGARILSPKMIGDQNALIAAVSNEGRMLVFPISELPELARGKGNKIINIPSSRLQSREEYVVDYGVVPEGGALVVHSGKRYLVMKGKDLEHYRGERGRRGHKLPRGFQKVDKLDVESN